MATFLSRFGRSCVATVALTLVTIAGAGVQAAPVIGSDAQAFVGGAIAPAYNPIGAQASSLRVAPLSKTTRDRFKIPNFYTKGLTVRGIPVVSSEKASDYALLECAYTLDHMFADSPQWVLSALTEGKTRMAVMSSLEYTMDLPENQEWQTDKSLENMAFWDDRARGMGGFPDASCAEENLLNLHSDPYRSENITIHEFSHTVAFALQAAKPQWYEELQSTYKKAMAAGLFAHTYAATDEQEYWATGVQIWFDCGSANKDTSIHNGIWNRQQLKDYDPGLAKLLAGVYGDSTWRYIRTDGKPLVVNGQTYTRSAVEMEHLAGLDRTKIPPFVVENSPRIRALRDNRK